MGVDNLGDVGYTVTKRANMYKQPRGGFLRPGDMSIVKLEDGETLYAEENVHGIIVGLAVDYLTRFVITKNTEIAFSVSLRGSDRAGKLDVGRKLASNIKTLSHTSIVNACKLVSFDVWTRDMTAAMLAKPYTEINPDKDTTDNIRVMVNRTCKFIKENGPWAAQGFTFEPDNATIDAYLLALQSGKSYGGYTQTVCTGDGDYLSKDTLWDLKVRKIKPDSKQTLQLLMYWRMGVHSGKDMFKSVKNVGIYNPRLNVIYKYDLFKLPEDVINIIDSDVIRY